MDTTAYNSPTSGGAVRSIKEQASMSNFEKAAASPETLGTFLSSLNVATEPWDESFHRTFCDSCKQENCDVEHCPHQDTQNNPTWWLTQAAEGERETAAQTANIVVWKNGRLVLEPGAIIQIRKEEPPANGVCSDFNVYLNGKGPEGKVLRNIKRVILPTISSNEKGWIEPAGMKIVFGGCEDAAEIIKRLGEKCKLEIRAAVQNQNKTGQVEFHGHKYILEAVPLELESDPLEIRSTTGLTVSLLVYR